MSKSPGDKQLYTLFEQKEALNTDMIFFLDNKILDNKMKLGIQLGIKL